MNLDFTLSEFNISGRPIPEGVADKILKWHIQPMQRVRDALDVAIWPSQKSGYRSLSWEKNRGRSGGSQHTFKGKGAVDWTCSQFHKNKDALLENLIEHTDYTRIAVYANFIHCDYKATRSGRREIYDSGEDSRWTLRKKL